MADLLDDQVVGVLFDDPLLLRQLVPWLDNEPRRDAADGLVGRKRQSNMLGADDVGTFADKLPMLGDRRECLVDLLKAFVHTAEQQSPRWAKVDDWRTRIYENSLLIAMGSIFLACWTVQSLNNWRAFNEEQRAHHEQTIAWGHYLLNPDFRERTLENWQFLAVGTLAVFTIYLRQRGSPESKPVGAAHEETASSG
jgi:hypothetical protein